ncbi:MAG: hypothetical protein HY898_26460 [Deltaproteobacteria bacterium]|nr:hypothetical protein [Deltaproteobacteria bacterium]
MSSFHLIVLAQDWDALRLGYAAQPALATLQSVPLDAPLFKSEPEDLEAYTWNTSTLVFTRSATERWIEAVAQANERKGGLAKLNRLKESLGMGSALERALYLRAFVVMVGQERIYGGVFLDAPSQMAIGFPVARVEIEQGRGVLHFLPLHLPFFQSDPASDSDAGQDAPRDVPSGMINHFRTAAMAPAAIENRRLLQDPRIRECLEAAGKLR